METDASGLGWGACCQGVQTGGRWSPLEKQKQINYLELLASFLALRRKFNVLLQINNVTAIAFLNRMGDTSGALRSSSENLGMVHREGDRCSHRTPLWQGDSQSGLGVTVCEGLPIFTS